MSKAPAFNVIAQGGKSYVREAENCGDHRYMTVTGRADRLVAPVASELGACTPRCLTCGGVVDLSTASCPACDAEAGQRVGTLTFDNSPGIAGDKPIDFLRAGGCYICWNRAHGRWGRPSMQLAGCL